MDDLAFRPLFLEAGRLIREDEAESPQRLPLRADLSLRSSRPFALESLHALFLYFLGPKWHCGQARSGAAVTLADWGGFVLRLSAGPEEGWEGSGWMERGSLRLEITLGTADRLVSCRNGGPARLVPLPEGDGPLYAALDGRESAEACRDSLILPPSYRELARERAGEGRA